MERILCVLIGYVCGLFQTSYLIGRLHGIDIREYGSGNAGTTNALRTLGKKAGALTLLGDILKPMAAFLICWLLFHGPHPENWKLLCMYGCLGAVLGHVFPFYMGFKGGKGIASMAGMGIIFGNVPMIVICLILFFVTVALTRYVSLGSLLIISAFAVMNVVFGQLGWLADMAPPYVYEWYGILAVYVVLAFWKHRANIGRLLRHEENKLSFGGKKE